MTQSEIKQESARLSSDDRFSTVKCVAVRCQWRERGLERELQSWGSWYFDSLVDSSYNFRPFFVVSFVCDL